MTMPTDVHTLSGAYVLNALSPVDRRRFEAHAAACPSCAREAAELTEVTARLAASVAEPPPERLRDRVFAEIGRTRQLPPDVGRDTGPDRDAEPPAAAAPVPKVVPIRWLHRVTVPVAAAAIVAAVVLGYQATSANRELGRQLDALGQVNEGYSALTELLAASDARLISRPAPGGGTATVATAPSRELAAVLASGMPAAPPGRTYQAWVMSPDGVRSAGLLSGTDNQPLVARGVRALDAIGVTVEPAGGSPQPTSDPILTVPLSRT